MEQIFGKGVSKGVAAGPISFYRRASGVIPRHEVSDTAAELERFRAARERHLLRPVRTRQCCSRRTR